MIPDTDFPDIRNKTAIHSNNGSCMVIPREGDKVRVYIQLTGGDVVDFENGRIDRSKMGPEKLLQVRPHYPRCFTMTSSRDIIQADKARL